MALGLILASLNQAFQLVGVLGQSGLEALTGFVLLDESADGLTGCCRESGHLVGYWVHPAASSSWDELAIKWHNGPATGEPQASSGPFGSGSWSSTDITRSVQGSRDLNLSLTLTTRSRQNVVFERWPAPVAGAVTTRCPAAQNHMLYHRVMARREVLVQLDDELVSRLDLLAAKVGCSRSELLRRGAVAVLEAAALAEADQQLVDAYRRQPQDPAIVAAAARLAAQTAPEW